VLLTSAVAAEDDTAGAPDAESARQKYEETVRSAAEEYVRTMREARREYIESLDAAMRAATRAGDLDQALDLRAQKHGQERERSVIRNPLALLSAGERAEGNLKLEPSPAVPLSDETLTARPWYVFHRTGQRSPEMVIRLQPDGTLRFLEGGDTSNWDEEQASWDYEDGHLVLTGRRGILARFEATHIVLIRSREDVPHRFFWIQRQISDPFLAPAGTSRR
jgi:hypothetical protein